MDSSALISAGSGLVGALVGAVAAVVGPAFLQKRQLREARERDRVDRRTASLAEFISALLQSSNFLPPFEGEQKAIPERVNRALTELQLTLNEAEQPVASYVTNLAREVAMKDTLNGRWGTVNQGGQALTEWARGVISMSDLTPFEFVRIGDSGQLMIHALDRWPNEPFTD